MTTPNDDINRPNGKRRRNFTVQPLEHVVTDHLYGRPSNRHELQRSTASNGPLGPVGPAEGGPAGGGGVAPHVVHIVGGIVTGMMLKGLVDGQ